MWSVFEKIYKCFKEDGIDFIDGNFTFLIIYYHYFSPLPIAVQIAEPLLYDFAVMMPSLDNYISYGKETVASNDSVRAMLFDMIDTVCIPSRLDFGASQPFRQNVL